jgi:VanZ family protein
MAVNRALISRVDPWLPPVALMALIFFLSAQPDLNSGLGVIDLVGRKLVHAGEYALLCFLWWRALRTVLPARRAPLAALAIAVAYSATDEFHQTFVHGRHGTPVDVMIDAVGSVSVTIALLRRHRVAATGERP